MNKSPVFPIIFFFLILSHLFSQNKTEFKRVAQWKHSPVFTTDVYSFIDKDNHLVAALRNEHSVIITPKKITPFGYLKQPPARLTGISTAFFYNDDLAIVAQPDIINVFTRKGGTYVWKETKALQRGQSIHIIEEGLFYHGKFFISGLEALKIDDNPKNRFLRRHFRLKVFAQNGTTLKNFCPVAIDGPTLQFEIISHLAGYHSDRVFFLAANELKLSVISADTLAVSKEVQLKVPSFYKKMPKTFYRWERQYELATWEARLKYLQDCDRGYSAIEEMVVDHNRLILQMRTANPKLKKFALLIYNADSFKLETTVFLDDYLLDVKDGKYYTYQNGHPARDEGTDQCIINIYSFVSKK